MKKLPSKQKVISKVRCQLNKIGLRREKKVFAIGFNKSGTSSLHALFISLGLPSHHGVEWNTFEDLKLLQTYDCFSDGYPRNLTKIDNLFPGSKFILQVRELDSWIYSRLAHIERRKKHNNWNGNPNWDNTEHAIKGWIRDRNAYHLFVLSYFSERPGDLLVVNFIRDESAATKVCNFLGYTDSYQKPEKNVNPHKETPLRHIEMLEKCIVELGISDSELKYDLYCPSLEKPEEHNRFPADSRMLETVIK